MTRRDTILIAALINAGLLVILFATAVTQDKGVETLASAAVETTPVVVATPQAPLGDEIDQVLNQYRVEKEPEPAPTLAFPAVPPKPEVVAKAPAPESVTVTVKKGDSLDKIARANGSTIAAIMQANGLSDSRLQIGQALQVPLTRKQPVEAPAAPDGESSYVMESGDSPWLVASKFQIPLDELLRINNLDEDRARRLKPGDKIRIR